MTCDCCPEMLNGLGAAFELVLSEMTLDWGLAKEKELF